MSTSSLTPSPSSSPALAPPNDDDQMAELDKIVSGALGIRAESKVDMKQIIVKVKELAKENVDQGNTLKLLAGAKLQPRGAVQNCKECARQKILSSGQTNPGGYSSAMCNVENIPVIKATKPPSRDKTTAMCNVENIPVIKAITPPSRDKNNSDFLRTLPWFWGEIPLQQAWEIMKETAIPGNYLVLQNGKLHYPILWMSSNGTIKVRYCGLLKFMKEDTFDDKSWEYSVRSFVQESENNTEVCVTPLPGKETYRKISQNRHYASLKKKIFCGWCQMYQHDLHLCREAQCWFHIDQNNLLFIRAKTRAEAARLEFWDRSGPRAEAFPTRKDMMLKLYNDAESYWTDKERKERQEWLNKQRAIAARMRPEEWEQYIKKLDIGSCE